MDASLGIGHGQFRDLVVKSMVFGSMVHALGSLEPCSRNQCLYFGYIIAYRRAHLAIYIQGCWLILIHLCVWHRRSFTPPETIKHIRNCRVIDDVKPSLNQWTKQYRFIIVLLCCLLGRSGCRNAELAFNLDMM